MNFPLDTQSCTLIFGVNIGIMWHNTMHQQWHSTIAIYALEHKKSLNKLAEGINFTP